MTWGRGLAKIVLIQKARANWSVRSDYIYNAPNNIVRTSVHRSVYVPACRPPDIRARPPARRRRPHPANHCGTPLQPAVPYNWWLSDNIIDNDDDK